MKKILGVALACLTLMSCSSDKKADSTTTKPAAASSSTTAGGASSSGESSTSTSGSSTTASTGTPTGDKNSPFCKAATKINAATILGNTTASPDQTKTEMQNAAKQIKEIIAIAPAELKADVGILAQVFVGINDILAKYNYDFTKIGAPAASADLQKFEALTADQKVQTASTHLDDYLLKVCGIDPNA